MDSKHLIGLCEAYYQVYEPENITEEVDIAAEYFMSEGLNEYGVEILIEELGLDEFVNFVYDIAESYILTEARRGGVKIEPKTKTGKSVGQLKGGAKSAAIARLRKEKEARREAESKSSAEKPSGLTSFMRDTAVKTARKTQPPTPAKSPEQKKTGVLGSIRDALAAAGERAKTDTELLKKSLQTANHTWQSASDTRPAKLARIAAKRAARGVENRGYEVGSTAGRLVGRAVRATLDAGRRAGQSETGQKIKQGAAKVVFKDDVDVYNTVLSHLLDEGYAATIESAEKIMVNMSEEWIDEILGDYLEETSSRLTTPRAGIEPIPYHIRKEIERAQTTDPKKEERRKKRPERRIKFLEK